MALLAPQLLDVVVAVGKPTKDDEPIWVASGFFYLRVLSRDGSSALGRSYLVSNRHVFEGLDQSAVIRMNPQAEDEQATQAEARLCREDGSLLWYPHPDPGIDVAVLPVDAQGLEDAGLQFTHIHSDKNALTIDGMQAKELCEGDEVFVLGFSMQMVGLRRNTTLVRGGHIARLRDLLARTSDSFYLDVFIFPGNSGGPVILKPQMVAIQGTKPQNESCLLGVVSSYVPYTDTAISVQAGRVRATFEENSGLAAAHPVDHIDEAIEMHLATLPETPAAEEQPAQHDEAAADSAAASEAT